ncbi:MAG: WD40/YVTN/BNR-like repeat-containing protein [Actinomycetota bacterium]
MSPHDGALRVATGQALSRGGDQGRTLQRVALPAKATAAGIPAVAVDPRTPRLVYVATGGAGIFRSEDLGMSWTAASAGLDGLDVRGLTVAPNDGRLHAQVRAKGLYRSFDGARAWERVDDGPKGTMHHLASVNIPTGMGGIFLLCGDRPGARPQPGLILRLHAGGRSAHPAAGTGATAFRRLARNVSTRANIANP